MRLLITEILEKRICLYDGLPSSERFIKFELQELLPQVRSLEEAQQNKIREEERQRIVGILEEMIRKYKTDCSYAYGYEKSYALENAITRLTNMESVC